MTSRTQILTAKQQKSLKSLKKSIPRSQVVRTIDRDDEIKNKAGQVLTYNSKKFHRINKKLDLEWTMSELVKPFLKNQIKKIERKNKINVKMPQNAVGEQKSTSEKWKFG